jgi:Dirigent-like protein
VSLHFPDSDPRAVIDGGKRGPSIGDVLFFKGALNNDSDVQVGAIIAQISTYAKNGAKAQIEGTITLTDQGTLVFAGQLDVSDNVENQGTLAIAGGTGDFQGAQGIATSTRNFQTGNVHIQITLI